MPNTPATPELVLASTSPYRRELLQRLRLPFQAVAPLVDETPQPAEPARDLAVRLAQAKALAVSARMPGAIVIGSDQVAICEGRLLGKPGGFACAVEQLRLMSGRDVAFHTAVAITDGTRTEEDVVVTRCHLRMLSDAEIEHYLHAEQPFDTAGSAKIESLGITLMQRVESDDPTALIGLPLIAVTRMLTSFGMNPLEVRA
jgi:septum formation protein